MSYSRWSDSVWYTFWDGTSGRTKNEQIFRICDLKEDSLFTYLELKTDRVECLTTVMKRYQNTTPEELFELKMYMLEFIADVENDKEIPEE